MLEVRSSKSCQPQVPRCLRLLQGLRELGCQKHTNGYWMCYGLYVTHDAAEAASEVLAYCCYPASTNIVNRMAQRCCLKRHKETKCFEDLPTSFGNKSRVQRVPQFEWMRRLKGQGKATSLREQSKQGNCLGNQHLPQPSQHDQLNSSPRKQGISF